jgi:hypothetical protein
MATVLSRYPSGLAHHRIRTFPLPAFGDASTPLRTYASRYLDVMTKQTTVRLPDDLADDAEAVARVRGESVNQLIIDSLTAEIERVRADDEFTARAKRLIERDREILDRLAK